MTHGGRREGSGRPRGAKDKKPRVTAVAIKKTAKLTQKVVAKTGGTLPLPYMLKIMNDPKQPQTRRDKMAIAAAGFCHPRLTVYAEMKRPSQMSDSELEKVIAQAEEDLLRNGVGRDKWPKVVH
jgi:hypothetical protein